MNRLRHGRMKRTKSDGSFGFSFVFFPNLVYPVQEPQQTPLSFNRHLFYFPEKRVISSNKGTSISYHDHLLIIEKKIYLFLKDEKTQITPGLVFGHIQAKSNEELLAKQEVDYAQKALRWAIIAFGAAVVFGLIDIILTILFNMNIIPS